MTSKADMGDRLPGVVRESRAHRGAPLILLALAFLGFALSVRTSSIEISVAIIRVPR
jgi:hypothetical protein